MLKQTCTKMLLELEKELRQISAQVLDPLDRLVQGLQLSRTVMAKVRALVLAAGFEDQASEIYFFKRIKPAFYCHQIYATEMYTIETGIPPLDREKQLCFLMEELAYLERYFKKYAFQYQYYRLEAADLDDLFFVRGQLSSTVLVPNAPDLDPVFSTSMDYLFSKFKAFEMLKGWILDKMGYLTSESGQGNGLVPLGSDPQELRWTGETVNLAELGYGLFLTKQLNHGSAGIGLIFRWLEEKFRVTIGIPAKRFAELRSRKRLSRTRFLDEMILALLAKMDQEDGLPGERPKGLDWED